MPRLYRLRLRARLVAQDELRVRLQRDPSDAELAADLGVTEPRMRQDYSDISPVQSIERGAGGQGDADRDAMELPDLSAESPFDAVHRQELIQKIEASLQPIEWTVLRMHYLEGKPCKDVAQELQLSAARICQIHLRVLSRLKQRLRADPIA